MNGAINFLEKCGDIGQWSDEGDSEGRVQIENLLKWARGAGFLMDFEPPVGALQDGGSEHQIFFDPKTHRVYKRTYPPGTFGLLGFGQKLERIGTPYFYLRRIALMNKVFNSDIRLEGVTSADKASIITSQPFYLAADLNTPHPLREEIAAYMYNRGFTPLAHMRDGWSRKTDGVIVLDTRSDNFVKTAKGLVPIDLVIQKGN